MFFPNVPQCSPYSILNRFFSTYLFSWYVYLNFNFCFLHNLRSLSSISPFVFLNYLLPCSMIYPELPVSGVSSDSFPRIELRTNNPLRTRQRRYFKNFKLSIRWSCLNSRIWQNWQNLDFFSHEKIQKSSGPILVYILASPYVENKFSWFCMVSTTKIHT